MTVNNMIELKQEDLRASENPYIQELALIDFIHPAGTDCIAQLLQDANRGLLINGKPIPEKFQAEEAISDYIYKEIGEKHGRALLSCYSQKPAYILPQSICLLAVEGGHIDYVLSATHSNTKLNIYVSNDKLHYGVFLDNMKCNHTESMDIPGHVFPGTVSSESIYDEKEKTFVFQKISCSNRVLQAIFMHNSFNGKLSIEEATEEEQTLNEINELRDNIILARTVIKPHIPDIPGTNVKHPFKQLDDTLSQVFLLLGEHTQHSNLRALLSNQKQICQSVLKKASQTISFVTGKRLLNTIAHILKLKLPFKNVKIYDDVHAAIQHSTTQTLQAVI